MFLGLICFQKRSYNSQLLLLFHHNHLCLKKIYGKIFQSPLGQPCCFLDSPSPSRQLSMHCAWQDQCWLSCTPDRNASLNWMQPLACCLNATGSSPTYPNNLILPLRCHKKLQQPGAKLSLPCPACLPGKVLVQSQQKCSTLWSTLASNKKPLQLLTSTGFSSSHAEDQRRYKHKEAGMSLMVLKAVLSYWGGHCKATQSTGTQTHPMCTTPASKQVKGFPFHKYLNVIIFCVKVPKRHIQKP